VARARTINPCLENRCTRKGTDGSDRPAFRYCNRWQSRHHTLTSGTITPHSLSGGIAPSGPELIWKTAVGRKNALLYPASTE
jgi:hypothetical protein